MIDEIVLEDTWRIRPLSSDRMAPIQREECIAWVESGGRQVPRTIHDGVWIVLARTPHMGTP